MRDAPKVHGAASELQQLRGFIADAARPALLSAATARTLAMAPGAATFAASDLAAAQRAASTAARTAAVTAPELVVAATAGLAVGGGVAYVTGSLGRAEERANPAAGLARVGESRRDDTCAPEGTVGNWVVLNRNGMKPDAIAYQQQIARMPSVPGGVIEYNVTRLSSGRTVNFDGCAYWSSRHELLEAKHGYGALYQASERYGFSVRADGSIREQAAQQTRIAGTSPVEWHFSDPVMARQLRVRAREAAAFGSDFSVHYTPAAR